MAKSYLSKEELLGTFYTLAELELLSRGHRSSEWGLRENEKSISFDATEEGGRLIISLDGMHEKARVIFGEYDPDEILFFWGYDEKWQVECTLILLTTWSSRYEPGPKVKPATPSYVQ